MSSDLYFLLLISFQHAVPAAESIATIKEEDSEDDEEVFAAAGGPKLRASAPTLAAGTAAATAPAAHSTAATTAATAPAAHSTATTTAATAPAAHPTASSPAATAKEAASSGIAAPVGPTIVPVASAGGEADRASPAEVRLATSPNL